MGQCSSDEHAYIIKHQALIDESGKGCKGCFRCGFSQYELLTLPYCKIPKDGICRCGHKLCDHVKYPCLYMANRPPASFLEECWGNSKHIDDIYVVRAMKRMNKAFK
jgi:hypothetical protein